MTGDAALIEALSTAEHRPTAALREAVARPDAVADAVLPLLRLAADGEILSPEQENLVFWGVHVLAHARDPRALPPLLGLLRQDEETLDAVLGDAVTSTLAKILASLFDGEREPYLQLILDSTVSDAVRQALFAACTFLCVEGRIERAAMHALLVRFDDAKVAVEGGVAWTAWEETVAQLGLRDLVPRVEAAQRDGRIDPSFSEPEWFRETLKLAERKPDDRTRFDAWQYGYLDDPVAALDWTREGAGEPQRNPFKDVGRNDPCPCGSGKKFKKCCLDKQDVEAPWMPPA